MRRRAAIPVVLVLALVVGVAWYLRRDRGPAYYTGFVEGEERILRSEVTGRVLEVAYGEGATVPADAVVARLDAADVDARLASKQREIDVLDGEIRTQEERVALTERTWERDLRARRAELRQAESAADLAARTFAREQSLVATGASTAQLLDDARAGRDQAASALARAREVLARTDAEQGTIAVARETLATLRERRALAVAQRRELEVTRAKYDVRAPAVPTVVQTQHLWPGELAQPGAPVLAVLDPADKYVQVYVPVAQLGTFRVGRRVEIELDGAPGRRWPGEVSFVADQTSFTPEKIETRSDRLGQVYRAKVRILEGAEQLQAGAEGNVYVLDGTG